MLIESLENKTINLVDNEVWQKKFAKSFKETFQYCLSDKEIIIF